MESFEQISEKLKSKFSADAVTVIENGSSCGQRSFLLSNAHALELARFLCDDAEFRMDFCSNVSGVDWPEKEVVEVIKKPDPADATKTIEEKVTKKTGGYLEVVYHLYSMELKQGPVIIRMRTGDRKEAVELPSLSGIWKSCDLQEREVFDLYGIKFAGHRDLRRLLMWDEFVGHPMRKDYVEPDDYEWEPTPHGAVLEKHKKHLAEGAKS